MEQLAVKGLKVQGKTPKHRRNTLHSILLQSNVRRTSNTRRRFNCTAKRFGGTRGGAATTTSTTFPSSTLISTPSLFSTFIPFEEEPDVRLPRTLRPLHYLVKLQPLINGNLSILGYMEVEIEVLEATVNITLHIADIITHNDTIRVRISATLLLFHRKWCLWSWLIVWFLYFLRYLFFSSFLVYSYIFVCRILRCEAIFLR